MQNNNDLPALWCREENNGWKLSSHHLHFQDHFTTLTLVNTVLVKICAAIESFVDELWRHNAHEISMIVCPMFMRYAYLERKL